MFKGVFFLRVNESEVQQAMGKEGYLMAISLYNAHHVGKKIIPSGTKRSQVGSPRPPSRPPPQAVVPCWYRTCQAGLDTRLPRGVWFDHGLTFTTQVRT